MTGTASDALNVHGYALLAYACCIKHCTLQKPCSLTMITGSTGFVLTLHFPYSLMFISLRITHFGNTELCYHGNGL